jgi:hypothetical protein
MKASELDTVSMCEALRLVAAAIDVSATRSMIDGKVQTQLPPTTDLHPRDCTLYAPTKHPPQQHPKENV